MKRESVDISFAVILAYPLTAKQIIDYEGIPLIYPEGLWKVPKRYAVYFRDNWIAMKSDLIISYDYP